MKVSMDGLRIEQVRSAIKLKDFIDDEILKQLNETDQEALKEKLDGVFQSINMGLCVYEPEIKDDFNDISDKRIQYYED